MQNDPQITQSAGRLSAVRGICAIRGSPGPARIKSDQPVQPRELGAPHAALALASPRAPAPHMPARAARGGCSDDQQGSGGWWFSACLLPLDRRVSRPLIGLLGHRYQSLQWQVKTLSFGAVVKAL